MPLQQEDIHLPIGAHGATLFMRRFRQADAQGPAVLMVHGTMSNGRIFYSQSGKGLAPFLADRGFDVFVADLQGKGESQPRIDCDAAHGQTEMICQDVPTLHAAVMRLSQRPSVHWVSHSWGGVLLNSALLRFPDLIPQVSNMVHFAAKRAVGVSNVNKFIELDVMWNLVLRGVTRIAGYLPAKPLRIGADNETKKTHRQITSWLSARWVDSDDGFDYGRAAEHLILPPTLYLAAVNDPCRGHPEDVQRFRRESGAHLSRVHVLARQHGAHHDYDHVSILTHEDAPLDQFKLAETWLHGGYEEISERG